VKRGGPAICSHTFFSPRVSVRIGSLLCTRRAPARAVGTRLVLVQGTRLVRRGGTGHLLKRVFSSAPGRFKCKFPVRALGPFAHRPNPHGAYCGNPGGEAWRDWPSSVPSPAYEAGDLPA